MNIGDDLAIIVKTQKELKRVLKRIIEKAEKYWLEFNANKTKYVIIGAIGKNKEKELNVSLITERIMNLKG